MAATYKMDLVAILLSSICVPWTTAISYSVNAEVTVKNITPHDLPNLPNSNGEGGAHATANGDYEIQYTSTEYSGEAQARDVSKLAAGDITSGHPEGASCTEEIPTCTFTYNSNNNYPYMFESPDYGIVERQVHIFNVEDVYRACLIDPFHGVDISPDDTRPVSIDIVVDCQSQNTRLAFRPSVNFSESSVIAKLMLRNCILYWKDISLFGQHVFFLNMSVDNWMDEFGNNEPLYYHDCIQTEEIALDVAEKNSSGTENGTNSRILGLQNLISFFDHGSREVTMSPVFTNHIWSSLGEVRFVMWVNLASSLTHWGRAKMTAIL